MHAHADKTAESPTTLTDRSRNKSNGSPACQLSDYRHETAQQSQAQEMASNSFHSMQLKAFGELMNNSRQVKQTSQLQAMAGKHHLRQHAPASGGNSLPAGGSIAQLQLATGPYRLKNTFFRTNLREDDANKTVKAKLPPRQQLMVMPKGNKFSNFSAGLIQNEHSWVQTQNNGKGWIEDSMLEASPFFNQAADQGSFIGNLQNRTHYLQELEGHVNLGSNFNAAMDTLNVVDARIQEAAVHLNLGQNAQVGHIRKALTANANPAIYDATIANHGIKNALWNNMLPFVDASVNMAAAAMSDEVKLKTKTALAQIISTAAGYNVMNQVNQLSGVLHIPINYVEEETQRDYNLYVTPHFNAVNANILESLTVTLPPDKLFNDAQSFKQISNTNLAGNSDMGQLGRRISVSPADTDLLHEFTHALHYLVFEERRRAGVANHHHDKADYRVQTGGRGQLVLKNQDSMAEARTIHRNQSFADLGALATAAIDPTIPATQEQADAFIRLGTSTQGVPTENDYRSELGLGARQDHHAMRVTDDGTFQQIGLESSVLSH